MKDIVIISHFCYDFSVSDNGRFMYLAKHLSKEHNVEIITSSFCHASKKKRESLTVTWPFKITFLDEYGYKKNVSMKRFVSHYIWGKNVEKYLKVRKKPDVVYCAIPSLTGPLAAAKYCESNDIKFIIDIQDLWPEAFHMVFCIPIISNVIFSPFQIIVNQIYRKADEICAVSESYVKRALSVNKKTKKGHTVFLGTNLITFDYYASNEPFICKRSGELWIGYCGSLSTSYDIASVIDALDILNRKKITPKFIVMGDGVKKDEFQNYALIKNVDALFTGNLPYDQMCALLCECDIVVNPIVKRSAASIINKHGDYAASGRPVINTQDSVEYRALVEGYEMGFNCQNGNAEDIAEKILLLLNDENLRKIMGKNARRCAEEKFNRQNSYLELIETITTD